MVWTSYSRTLNKKINNLQKSALQIVYISYDSSYNRLLKMYQSFIVQFFAIHWRNKQSLAIDLFKVKQNISSHMTNNIFRMRYNLRYYQRSQNELFSNSGNAGQFGLNSLRVFNSEVWNMAPNEIKNRTTLIFSRKR